MSDCGIYQIRNLFNDHIYIGGSTRLHLRSIQHKTGLNTKKHRSKILQTAYDTYGAKNFVFEPLITCAPSMLKWYEQQFIDKWKPTYNTYRATGKAGSFVVNPIESERKRRATAKRCHQRRKDLERELEQEFL